MTIQLHGKLTRKFLRDGNLIGLLRDAHFDYSWLVFTEQNSLQVDDFIVVEVTQYELVYEVKQVRLQTLDEILKHQMYSIAYLSYYDFGYLLAYVSYKIKIAARNENG